MLIIGLNDVSYAIAGRTIFQGLNWEIKTGARIGLVGPNGAGKSTLQRLLIGEIEPTSGLLTTRRGLRIARLPQHLPGDTRTALATLRAARPDVQALENAISSCEQQLTDPAVQADLKLMERVLEKHGRLLEQYEQLGGARLENDARGWLRSLELDEADWNLPTQILSGGQRKLIALAACLIQRPDVLLLDEPETHLDLQHRRQLEKRINEFDGSVIIVSHDRYLLDETVSEIAELESGRLTLWQGNYSAFAVERELALQKQAQDYSSQQKEIARLEEAIKRFKLWASLVDSERHARQARVKQMQIDKMDKVEKPVLERRKLKLHLRSAQRGGQKIVELREVSHAFGDDVVLLGLEETIWRGERVGIIGPNGAGKSVLGKLLVGAYEPSDGDVWRGPAISIGYFAQGVETLDHGATPVEMVRLTKAMYEDQAIAFLGQFLFSYALARQPIATLSGGERARLQLALLMLERPNCLLLDEPTNHLDIESAEVLESALENYDGTVIVISHDRYFLDRVVDRLLVLEQGSLHSFEGGYSRWLEATALV